MDKDEVATKGIDFNQMSTEKLSLALGSSVQGPFPPSFQKLREVVAKAASNGDLESDELRLVAAMENL